MNPSALQPSLREAVCQQCHLQGDVRVLREGRRLSDFRPGLALSAIESVFVKDDDRDKTRFFGQVEQMYDSRCFRDSSGRMGCISCHDPHQVPDPREKAAYYRDRCLSCHAEKGCTLPTPERIKEGRDDRCIDCHMPRSSNEQVPHTATTLHLIRRFKDRPEPRSPRPSPSKQQAVPLRYFHRDQLDGDERPEIGRELGIALALSAQTIPGMTAKEVSRMALPLLEGSLKVNPADGPALESKGTALWLLGRREESLATSRAALAGSPDHEGLLVAAGIRAAQLKKHEEALTDFKRAIAINPWRSDYHHVLALSLFSARDSGAAIDAARDSVSLNPSNHEARMLLIQSLLKAGRQADARKEFRILLDQDPPGRDSLQTWFARSVSP